MVCLQNSALQHIINFTSSVCDDPGRDYLVDEIILVVLLRFELLGSYTMALSSRGSFLLQRNI